MATRPEQPASCLDDSPHRSLNTRIRSGCQSIGRSCYRHLSFLGPGIVASVAYMDPGNWTVDLQAGASYGYRLLFVILICGLCGILFQVQATRLGIVTGLDLARHTRLMLHDRPRHKLLIRWGVLYPLYVLAEIAIIATDLAELLGSAIALNLLFPKLPLWAGVLITGADVLLVLAFFQTNGDQTRRGSRTFEIIVVSMVLGVFGCFVALVVKIGPEWNHVFQGYLPSKYVFGPGALYTSVGILGATVMPHALFIGSRLATVDRLDLLPIQPAESTTVSSDETRKWKLPSRDISAIFPASWRSTFKRMDLSARRREKQRAQGEGFELGGMAGAGAGASELDRVASKQDGSKMASELDGEVGKAGSSVFEGGAGQVDALASSPPVPFNRLNFIEQHITHATIDIVFSLLGFAITINSAILVIASAAFYGDASAADADLFEAYRLIKDYIGTGAALLFAIALLFAGQSASITATLAGQCVSEGFIEWKTSPFIRRLVTRLIGMVPSIAVSVAVGRDGIDTLLVASQVSLSIILPFVIFPLIVLCSHSDVMIVKPPSSDDDIHLLPPASRPSSPEDRDAEIAIAPNSNSDAVSAVTSGPDHPAAAEESEEVKGVSFKSSRLVTAVSYLIWAVIVLANAYVIVILGLGREGDT